MVLLDYMAQPSGPFENLVRVDGQGRVVWRAPPPPGSVGDAYVSFSVEGDNVANSWSGYRVILDAATGKICESRFVKQRD